MPATPGGSDTGRSLAQAAALAAGCTRCRLAAGRTHVVYGEGDPSARLMVIGEGPGRDEDIQGRPFVGRSGRLLERLLAEEASLERSAVYIANVVKCRPPNNRDPQPDEVAACRPWLEEQMDLIQPKVVLTLGNFATRAVLGRSEGITALRGRAYPLGTATAVPTFHPAAALRGGGDVLARMRADFVRAGQALRDPTRP